MVGAGGGVSTSLVAVQNAVPPSSTGVATGAIAFSRSLGAAIWVGTWSAVGYLAGNHLDTIYAQVKRYELYLLIALAVVVVALVVRHLLRRPHQRGQGEEPR